MGLQLGQSEGLKMVNKPAVFCLVLSLAISYGAVVPQQEDALFDMVQSFLIQPDEFATSLGMTRVKRSAFDTDFKFDKLGLHVQIKYLDPNNHLKGGKAVITIDNLQKFVRRAHSTFVKLTIDFDSGASPKDGLFKMKVDYELHHRNVEKGTFEAERKKAGGLWKTDVSVKSGNNAAIKLIPVFTVSLKSDRQTMMEGTYSSECGNNYNIKVDRTPGKKIHAVITGNGRTYTIDGVLDKAQKNVQINIDANGLKSNTNVLKSFKIEKMAGDMRRVELNGKELVKAGFSQADNSISQTTTLPDGRSLTTTISWKSD